MPRTFDRNTFRIHVEQFQLGSPTARGYVRGQELIAQGATYRRAAEVVVSQGLTENGTASGWELCG